MTALEGLFWHVGLLPLAAVAVHGRRLPSAWWWLAAAFAVSWLADLAGWLGAFPLASQTYPLAQGALFALVLAPRPVAVAVIGVLAVVSGVSLSWRGAAGLDVLLHVAAFGSTAGLAWHYLAPGVLRWTLAGGFAALALAWVAAVLLDAPDATWLAYGGIRVATACGFAVAAWRAAEARPA